MGPATPSSMETLSSFQEQAAGEGQETAFGKAGAWTFDVMPTSRGRVANLKNIFFHFESDFWFLFVCLLLAKARHHVLFLTVHPQAEHTVPLKSRGMREMGIALRTEAEKRGPDAKRKDLGTEGTETQGWVT